MKNRATKLCLLLAFAMLLVLAGCGGSGAGNQSGLTSTGGDTAAATPTVDTGADTAFSPSDGIDENGFWEGIRALDYVELPQYQGMSIPSDVHQITDEIVQGEIDALLAEYASSEQITDRAVASGDTVNIDYVGSVDGVEFEGGSTGGAGTEVTAGSPDYIDDFLTQIIGHMPGDTFDVNVTFPGEYPQNTELQNKDAVFVTTINFIVGSTTPELTDAFVAENLSAEFGWTTVAELREGTKTNLRKNAIQKHIGDYLYNEVSARSIPDQLLKYQENSLVNYHRQQAAYSGMSLEEFLTPENSGVSSVDELIQTYQNDIKMNASYTLVIQALAEDAGLSVSEEDMVNFFKPYTDGTGDYSSLTGEYGLPYMKQSVLGQKVLELIAEKAVLA